MGHAKHPHLIDDLLAAAYPIIQRAARARSVRFLSSLRAAAFDPSDLEQEIMLGVLAALLDFDDSRSSLATFIDRIAESKTLSVLRKTAAKKRNHKDASLILWEPINVFLAIELSLDLERALEKLTKKDRDVARLLVEHKPAEAARRLKVSRPAIYRRIARLREVLTEAGF